MSFFIQLSNTAFFVWVREGGSLWGYPAVLFLHTLGLATVAGLSAGIDLRLLGFASGVPLAPLERFFRLIWVAFAVTAVSGVILLLADPETKLVSPVFYIKLLFIAAALATTQMLRKRAFQNPSPGTQPLPSNIKLLAVTSLLFWIAATLAGRLMAYIGPVKGLG